MNLLAAKIYYDGSNWIAIPHTERPYRQRRRRKQPEKSEELQQFEERFEKVKGGRKSRKAKLLQEFTPMFKDEAEAANFAEQHFERLSRNRWERYKRMIRRGYTNRWNFFCTYTYDSQKHTEETFRSSLMNTLYHFSARRDWRYMGVFEYSPEKGRIHFHMLAYIPDGQMLGRITEKQSYSPQEGRMKTRHENDFFAAAFGVNDFEEIDGSPRAYRRAVEYILKYVEKQSERIVYSRGIMTAFCRKLIGLSSRWLGGLGSIRRTDKLHPFGGRHYDVFPVGQSCHLLSGLPLIERARSRRKP